ncbi:hypothetical protein FRB94_013200 [Tulasnella sp. JGI-2019a]|nr:hypothetical protein FRB93_011807 [Tulasnella sp. JGI-2019a]KAG9008476.1 hypothetical protein FRB94_013200 [Tulasnella sp. JGI-2019a]KAG9034788.1 hypothetical protein FRB95_012609 [Tulasnella sp. JGI-2019a]
MAAVPPATQSANLNPPKQDAISKATLSTMNGANGGPIWLAIKGHVFDVSSKPDMYGPGGGYSVFAGKDGSKGLGLGSLKPEDAVPDDGALGPAEQKVLDDWLVFFQKRYNQVGLLTA